MTESSAFWDGTTVGDAASGAYTAPYDATVEFNRIFSRALGSDAQGFVIPNLLNNLRVQASSPAAATVDVLSGGALIKGFHYLNDAPAVLTIAANASGSPRLDRIVLRVSWAAQTVRLAVVQGTPAATPTLPALTQVVGTTWELPLAYVWVANGFATIGDAEIHEERAFMQTMHEANGSDLSGHNLIFNSEFMAYGDLPTAPPTLAPEGWVSYGAASPPPIVSVTKYGGQPRGRALQMTAGAANRGLAHVFNVPASTMIAIKTVMKVNAGDVGEILVTTNSGAPFPITRTMRRTGAFVEETIFYITEADASVMTLALYCVNNTDVVTLGQTLAVVGYFPGRFREIHEHISFFQGVQDASYNFTAKSTSAPNIDVLASFGNVILPGTKAIDVLIGGNDSGSAAGSAGLSILTTIGSIVTGPINDLSGIPNDKIKYQFGTVLLNPVGATLIFKANIVATGVGTHDVYIAIVGIHT